MRKKIGQITIKRIGKKYSVCISGTPVKLFDYFSNAEREIIRIRKKFGRRHYGYKRSRM